MKKQIFAVLVLLQLSQFGYAQLRGSHAGNSGVGGNLSIQNNDGTLIPIGAQSDTKGNPFLLENWSAGKVYLKSGTIFADTGFNFSLFDDQLYFIKNNKLFKVTEPIASFVLFDNENASKDSMLVNYQFATGFPSTSQTNASTFFQLLHNGKHYQLLKWQHKKVRETYDYGGKVENEYATQLAYYIFDQSSGKMMALGNKPNIQQIKNVLSIDESIWKAYTENHAVHSKGERPMIELISYLNK